MAPTSTNDIISHRSADVVPLFDLTQLGEMNGRVSTTLQTIGKEWAEFVGTRLSADNHLFETLHGCKSVPEMQQACAQFWLHAVTQYGEEAQRLMRITQGAAEQASPAARQPADSGPDIHQAA